MPPKKKDGIGFAEVDKYPERPYEKAKADEPEPSFPQADQDADYHERNPRFVQDKAVEKFLEEQGISTPQPEVGAAEAAAVEGDGGE